MYQEQVTRLARTVSFFATLLVASQAFAVAFDPDDVQTVFFIRKTATTSRVEYGVRLDAECRPEGKDPVVGYWRRLNVGPDVTADLSWGARRAYGISQQSVRHTATGGEVVVRLRALSSRPIVIHSRRGARGCEARASIQIEGAWVELVDIFVEVAGRLSVDYVALTGRARDGRRVVETIRP